MFVYSLIVSDMLPSVSKHLTQKSTSSTSTRPKKSLRRQKKILSEEQIFQESMKPNSRSMMLKTFSAKQLEESNFTMSNNILLYFDKSIFLDVVNLEQEGRQLKLVEYKSFVRVNVAREDFPSIQSDFDIYFYPSAPQAVWGQFLSDVGKKLGVEFIDNLIDRKDGSTVHRILCLRPGGLYFLRQRETSCVLEVLSTGNNPIHNSWEVTSHIGQAKNLLEFEEKNFPLMEDRIKALISRPMTKWEESSAIKAIIDAKTCPEILKIVDEVRHGVIDPTKIDEANQAIDDLEVMLMGQEILSEETKQTKIKECLYRFKICDPEIDLVSLLRLSIEAINRLIVHHDIEKDMMVQILDFLLEISRLFPDEVDLIVLALKLVNDTIHHLGSRRVDSLNLIMDSLQRYAPQPPPNRPRDPPRLRKREELLPADNQNAVEDTENVGESIDENPQKVINPLLEKNMALIEGNKLLNQRKPRGGAMSSSLDDNATMGNSENVASNSLNETTALLEPSNPGRDDKTSKMTMSQEIDRGLTPTRKGWKGSKGALGVRRENPNKGLKDQLSIAQKFSRRRNPMRASMLEGDESMGTSLANVSNLNLSADSSLPLSQSLRDTWQSMTIQAPANYLRLPQVSGMKFRGYVTSKKYELVVTQGFACLYSYVNFHYGNRLTAMEMEIPEELSDIVLVMNDKPRILEYYVWIINRLYSDGFPKDAQDELPAVVKGMRKLDMSSLEQGHIDDDQVGLIWLDLMIY